MSIVVVDVLVPVALLERTHTVGSHAQTGDLAGNVVALAVLLSFAVVGGLLAVRLPRNLVAWLLLSVATSWVVFQWLPGGWVPPIGIMGIHLLLRFPDGRLPSPRWRWFSRFTVALIVVLTFVVSAADPTLDTGTANPYYVPGASDLGPLLLLLPVSILCSAASLRVRFRRAGVVEREQIRWIAWAGGFIGLVYTVTLVLSLMFDSNPGTSGSWTQGSASVLAIKALQLVALLSFTLLPASIGVAVLRYRLYDIDRLVSRTTSYLVVTALAVGVYAVVVTFTSRLLPASSSLTVALATLIAAAAFRPALTRVQRVVDRRFDRRRYDGARVVDEFGMRLRGVVATDDIARGLASAVATTLQPDSVRLWLRE